MSRPHTQRFETSTKVAGGIFGAYALFWLIWAALKIPAFIILVVNVVYLIGAVQAGTVGTFDFTWLVISLAAFLVL